jgi:hypothetical protein
MVPRGPVLTTAIAVFFRRVAVGCFNVGALVRITSPVISMEPSAATTTTLPAAPLRLREPLALTPLSPASADPRSTTCPVAVDRETTPACPDRDSTPLPETGVRDAADPESEMEPDAVAAP